MNKSNSDTMLEIRLPYMCADLIALAYTDMKNGINLMVKRRKRRKDATNDGLFEGYNIYHQADDWFNDKSNTTFSFRFCLFYAKANPNAVLKKVNETRQEFDKIISGIRNFMKNEISKSA